MKKITRIIFAAVALAITAFSTGCASRTIDAATTKLEVKIGDTTVAVALPKELDATKFALVVNPTTNEYKLTADRIKSSSQHVIDSAGAAQAEALAQANSALAQVIPLLRPQQLPQPPAADGSK